MIEELIEKVDVKSTAVFVVGAAALLQVAQWINVNVKIRSLGGRAYRVKTWLPGGAFSSWAPHRSY
jgi:hypothetical protein